MLSASRILSTPAAKAALSFVALCACASPEPPNPGTGTGMGLAGTTGTARGPVSMAAAGTPAKPTVSGAAGMPIATMVTAGMTAAVAGSAAKSGNAAGAGIAGGAAQAGMGGLAAVAGMSAIAGSGGAAGGAGGSSAPAAGCEVAPITAEMRDKYEYMNDSYYTKYADANGVIVATGSKVVDEALVRYCHLLSEMFSNEKVRQGVIAEKMWFTMISQSEQLSSLPQIDKQYGTSLNMRARGLGALTPTICAEDSIMCMKGDPWNGDCICPHETGHTLYSSGIAKVPELSKRLTTITNNTRSSGRLSNAYVWQDGNESGMMSWGVQAWYNCAINGTQGQYHTDINTRAELQKELPEFYQFLSELLPQENQYKDCYYKQ